MGTIAPPPPAIPATVNVSVLSFNLQWHALHNGKYIDPNIAATTKANGPFDIIGLQECEDVDKYVAAFEPLGGGKWGTMQLRDGPHDIAVAWNTVKYKNISSGFAETGKDGWWVRQMQWLRLEVIGTKDVIFFANVHGAVGKCSGPGGDEVIGKYRKAIKANMKAGDHLFFTGDFNCGQKDDVIVDLGTDYIDAAHASYFYPILLHPDHIFTSKSTKTMSWTGVCCARAGECKKDTDPTVIKDGHGNCVASPSDHELLKGVFTLHTGGATSNIVV